MDILKGYVTSFIGSQSEAFWEDFLGAFKPVKLKKGEFFVQPGKIEAKVGFLLSGITRTYFTDAVGKDFNKHFNVANSFLGAYSSMITQSTNHISIQALTPCDVLIASHKELETLTTKHPVLDRLFRKLAEWLYVKKEVREREFVMLDAKERYTNFQERFPNLEQHVPQYHIASYLGITPTQLSRIRSPKREK